jgi:hypothetical protein
MRWAIQTSATVDTRRYAIRCPFFTHGYVSEAARWRDGASFQYRDVFDPDYHRQIRDMAGAVTAPVKAKSNLLGYYRADLIEWDIDRCRRDRGTDWVTFHRARPGTAPGKQAYVKYLLERHGSAEAVAGVYRIASGREDFLLSCDFTQIDLKDPAIRADDEAFLGAIAGQLFGVLSDAFTHHDQSHLIFGERFEITHCPAVVLDAIVPFVDVISIQWGAEFETQDMIRAERFDLTRQRGFEATLDRNTLDEIHRRTGKPIIICDHHISFATDECQNTQWHQASSQTEALKLYETFLKDATETPYIVGLQRCQYISAMTIPGKLLKQGLLDLNGQLYQPYAARLSEVNRDAMIRWRERVDSE